MILLIRNRDNFIKNFLNPISRLAPTCTLNVDGNMSTIVHNNSNIFLKAEYELEWDDHTYDCLLCLPDTIKLIKILSCLEEENIQLKHDENCLRYNNGQGNRFKYHLFDDSLSTKSPFDFNKINQIQQWSKFTLKKENNNAILKALPFVTESSKLYLTNEENNIYAELSDKKIQNVDSYTTKISEDFEGDNINGELILDVELFRLISTLNFENIQVYINNDYKMLKLNIDLDKAKLIFVSTSYKN
tara:strand:- start:399 stop:1133 length:735 start_codon:yes stop_codon:yes gene_type:complete